MIACRGCSLFKAWIHRCTSRTGSRRKHFARDIIHLSPTLCTRSARSPQRTSHEPPALPHLIPKRHNCRHTHEKDGSGNNICCDRFALLRGRRPRNRRRLDVVASIEGREAVVVRGHRERDALPLRRRADVSTADRRHGGFWERVRGLRLLVHPALVGAPTASANCLSNSYARRPGAGPSTAIGPTRATASGQG